MLGGSEPAYQNVTAGGIILQLQHKLKTYVIRTSELYSAISSSNASVLEPATHLAVFPPPRIAPPATQPVFQPYKKTKKKVISMVFLGPESNQCPLG